MRRSSFVWEAYRAALTAHPEVIQVAEEALLAGRVRVADRDGRVVGFSVTQPGANGATELDGLFVEPDEMGHGVGRALVLDAIVSARARVMEVTAGPEAKGFYIRLGFVETGPIATRFAPAFRLRYRAPDAPPAP